MANRFAPRPREPRSSRGELDAPSLTTPDFPSFRAVWIRTIAIGMDDLPKRRVARPLCLPLAGEEHRLVEHPHPFEALAPLHARVDERWIECRRPFKAGLGGGVIAQAKKTDAFEGMESRVGRTGEEKVAAESLRLAPAGTTHQCLDRRHIRHRETSLRKKRANRAVLSPYVENKRPIEWMLRTAWA